MPKVCWPECLVPEAPGQSCQLAAALCGCLCLLLLPALQPLLAAGAGFTGRDAESGMLLIDRSRWLAVLQWALWINTWHEQLYYRVIHGDKVRTCPGSEQQCCRKDLRAQAHLAAVQQVGDAEPPCAVASTCAACCAGV
jgi:hypothetical protein